MSILSYDLNGRYLLDQILGSIGKSIIVVTKMDQKAYPNGHERPLGGHVRDM